MRHSFRIYLMLFIVLGTGIVSCNIAATPKSVIMNNTMVQINDSLFYMGREFGNTVSAAVTARDFSKLTPVRQHFENFIDSNRNKLYRMKDVDGSEPLRRAEMDLLDVEKRMIVNDFTPFEKLTSFATYPEITGLFDKIKADSKDEEDKMSIFKREQKIYAKRNGFKLVGSSPQNK